MGRLLRRPAFDALGSGRLPKVSFYTSSYAKYFQARMVLDAVGLRLASRRHSSEAYHEDYNGTKEELLAEAIAQLRRQEGQPGAIFFIEDTSIRIEALSNGSSDFPGLGAKEWFARTSFDELDAELRRVGNRRATVKSCIALAVPGLERPLYFYGETNGEVAEKPAVFEPDPFYPWLVPDNFSAWLRPDGATRTLAEMSFEESLDFDFRVGALISMVDRLEEYTLAMNATPAMYYKPHRAVEVQPALFPLDERPVLLVIGPTCAGKTTFGAYAQQNTDWDVVDASSIVRVMAAERMKSDLDTSDFAHALLEDEGFDVVARRIFERFVDSSSAPGLVVTGFRAIEEIEYLRRAHNPVRVVSIEAPEQVRFDRYTKRNTRRRLASIEEFRRHDQRQHELGLLGVAPELSDFRVSNTFDVETYYNQVASIIGGGVDPNPPGVTRIRSRTDRDTSQLFRCLVVLRRVGRPLTTQEIEEEFPASSSIRYNNANKILKRYPGLARRLDGSSSNVRYQITSHGLSYLSAVERLSGGRSDAHDPAVGG